MSTLVNDTSRRNIRGGRTGSRAVTAMALGAIVLHARPAVAGPAGASAGGSVSTDRGSSARSKGGGYDWPELVIAGNAISFLSPLQFGIVNYLPKGRFTLQYDRQILKNHWIHVGLALLFDRGDFKNFRMKECGIADRCNKGGVVGVDVYAGYAYKFFVAKRPWIVPYVRASVGYNYFSLPKVRGHREQSRVHSQGLSLRPGAGLRVFPLEQLGVGLDVALPIGFLVHTERPDDGSQSNDGAFLFGIEVLPLSVEYRF